MESGHWNPEYWDPQWDDPVYVKALMENHFPKDWEKNSLDRILVQGMKDRGFPDLEIAAVYRDQL